MLTREQLLDRMVVLYEAGLELVKDCISGKPSGADRRSRQAASGGPGMQRWAFWMQTEN